jgi:signal recognition particle receptor subunit beta
MALLNYANRKIFFKVVYCGPALSGKTTNIECLHAMIEPARRGKLLPLWTGKDRILSFDILPSQMKKDKKLSVGFHVCTIPGQLRDETSWKTVLKGADAIVFVADSLRRKRDANVESLTNIYASLPVGKVAPTDIPVTLQFNKRDLKNILTKEELIADLNEAGYPYLEAIALRGLSVKETFQKVARDLVEKYTNEHLRDTANEQPRSGRPEEDRSVLGNEDREGREGRLDFVLRKYGHDIKAETPTSADIEGRRPSITPLDRQLTLLELRMMRESKRSAWFISKLDFFHK